MSPAELPAGMRMPIEKISSKKKIRFRGRCFFFTILLLPYFSINNSFGRVFIQPIITYASSRKRKANYSVRVIAFSEGGVISNIICFWR